MKFIRIIPFILLFSDACVEPFDLPVVSTTVGIVVDGMITNQPGPYTVKLFLTSALDEDATKPTYVSGAIVEIEDNQGNSELLQEESSGIYKTSLGGLQGVIGRAYKLVITTADGQKFQSESIEMQPAGEIEELYFEFKENSINPNDLTKPQDAFWVYLNGNGDENSDNLIRWRWNGVYHDKTYPELHVRHIGPAVIPDPLPCSGYVIDSVNGGITKVDVCICCDCWVPQYSTTVLLSDNDVSQPGEFNDVLIAKIPVDKRLFYEKYYLDVDQLSLSEDVYEFWELLKAQEAGSSSIFQPNIVKVKGNIHAVTKGTTEVFGIFSVSATDTKQLFLKRSDIPKLIPVVDTITVDCRTYAPNASNQKPPFW